MIPRSLLVITALGTASLVVPTAASAGPLGPVQPPAGAQTTAVSLSPGATGTTYGKKVKLRARLRAGSEALAGRRIELYKGSDSAGWSPVKHATTDGEGRALFSLAAGSNATYVAAYQPTGGDAALYAPSESGAAQVSVQPRLRVQLGGGGAAVLPGRALKIRVMLQPYLAGERIQLRIFRRHRSIVERELTVTKSGDAGVFNFTYKPGKKASYKVTVTHIASDNLAGGPARSRKFTVAIPSLGPGGRGRYVRILQRMLRSRGYVTPVNGVYGKTTGIAVRALRKTTGMGDSTTAGRKVWRRLAKGGGAFKLRYPNSGHHVELDWSRQVLVLASGGKPVRTYPASSGKPSTPTPFGSFRFYTRTAGYNAKGMYYSTFFIAGYAVHGYADVPSYPASHGCIRVPISSAIGIYSWINLGDPILIYR